MDTRTRIPTPPFTDLSGKVAFVTGGSRGIGAETCRMLAAHGAKVAVGGRDTATIEQVVGAIRSSGQDAMGLVADCTDFAALTSARAKVEREFGPVDLIAAFAGGLGNPVPTWDDTPEHWRTVLDVNLTATFLTLKCFLPGMCKRRRGAIVTIASSAGRMPSPASAAYASAKAGVMMFTRHLANEVAGQGVRVNCIAPAAIRTERMEATVTPEQFTRITAGFPLGRLGTPHDVAAAAAFLLSDLSAWITGITLDVAGGRVAG